LNSAHRRAFHDPFKIPSRASCPWRQGGAGEGQTRIPSLQAGYRFRFVAGERLDTAIPGVRPSGRSFLHGFNLRFRQDPRTVNRAAKIVGGNDIPVVQFHFISFRHFSNSGQAKMSTVTGRLNDSYSALTYPSNHFYGNNRSEIRNGIWFRHILPVKQSGIRKVRHWYLLNPDDAWGMIIFLNPHSIHPVSCLMEKACWKRL
jgi:hypothetical protein